MKKLTRPKEGRVIAGVSLGIAKYFGFNITVVRIVWLFLLIPGGLPGIVPYVILWLLMPSE